MLDLAALLARPREEVHVLDLVQAGITSSTSGDALDRKAVSSYRTRLAQLSQDRLDAEGDPSRLAQVEAEHDALTAELSRSAGGHARSLGTSTAERARKAVAARLRAVRRIDEVLPELASHLDRSLVTGVRCRYTGDETWRVET